MNVNPYLIEPWDLRLVAGQIDGTDRHGNVTLTADLAISDMTIATFFYHLAAAKGDPIEIETARALANVAERMIMGESRQRS